jgi:hypothetical protein
MQEQTGQLYRTEALKGDQAPRDAWQLLERAQRALSESADDLHEQMQPADDAEGPTPGRRQLESAQEAMRRAADRLGELQQDESEKAQRDVLAELQRSLAELDDALRQVRREEVAETLAALETRFRALLSRQEEIRRTVTALGAKSVEQWQRDDENALAAAATLQQQAAEDCRTIRRLLVNEGTTLVLPELTEEIAGDMAEVAAALQGADVGPVPRARIDEIIALLQEVLDAIAQQREQQAEEPPPTPPGQQAPPGGSGALLPASTELKLLRSAQVRINNQTTTLAEQAEGEPVRQRRLETLAQRQQRLAELAWQLVERK